MTLPALTTSVPKKFSNSISLVLLKGLKDSGNPSTVSFVPYPNRPALIFTWSPCINVRGTNPVSPSSTPAGFKLGSPTLDKLISPPAWATLYTCFETIGSSLGKIIVVPTLSGASSINEPVTNPSTSTLERVLLTTDISPTKL